MGLSAFATASATVDPTPARAQAYNATPAVVGGNATFANGPGTTTITVETPQAIIDWRSPSTPTNPFIFLPAGNVATYQNGINTANFAVLNRILVSVPSRFDGRVVSQLRDSAGALSRGGTVAFQSSGGIIVGSGAAFDVGNLVLTTLTVGTNANAGTWVEPDGTIRFTGAVDPASAVTTQPGSAIQASAEGSWVGLVAPRVSHGGLTDVNGSAAYVAMRAGSIRVDQGLFDIVVTTGTNQADAITHSGDTGGPSSTGAADRHRIYLVAAAEGAATQMLLGGTIGFDDAANASIENGVIYLSSGRRPPQITDYTQVAGTPIDNGAAAGSIAFQSLDIRSRLQGFATRSISLGTAAFNPRRIANVDLYAGDSITTTANADSIFAGNLGADLLVSLATSNGDIRTGNVLAGNDVAITAAGALNVGDVTGAEVRLAPGTSITGGAIRATGNRGGGGNDDVELRAPGAITIPSATTASEDIIVESGSFTAMMLDSADDINVLATGAIDIGTAQSDTSMTLRGATTDLDSGTAGTAMALIASAGALTAGTLTAGSTMALNASQNVNFTTATAGSDLAAIADGAIAFTSATGAEVRLTAGTTITGGTVSATGNRGGGGNDNVELTAPGAITITSASTVSEDIIVRSGAFSAAMLDSADGIDVVATGAADIGTARSGGVMAISGVATDLDVGNSGGPMTLAATHGNLVLGTLTSAN
ncbi:MAG: hypothetical protein KKE69_03460, partial [Alphaproteobacteria bacterium]|nr:hypothetical protein [Alphaproteobacteria bacterium]